MICDRLILLIVGPLQTKYTGVCTMAFWEHPYDAIREEREDKKRKVDACQGERVYGRNTDYSMVKVLPEVVLYREHVCSRAC